MLFCNLRINFIKLLLISKHVSLTIQSQDPYSTGLLPDR